MPGSKWKRYLPALAVALLIALAYSLRYDRSGAQSLTLLRSGIYFGLFIDWGVSVNQRIIHPRTRRLFTAIAVMMVLWMSFRTIRYLSPPKAFARYCWYLFYIPMLYIPLFTSLITALLGRPESFRLPRWVYAFYAAAGCIVLLVLTNDFHRLVFVFPQGAPIDDGVYRYGRGFLFPAVWCCGGLLATLLLVFVRSRLPGRGKRLLLPVIPALLLLAYHFCYLMGFPWLRDIFGDLTVTECVLVVCILECCLRTGLIPSNTGYDELMRVCDFPMAVVDGQYRTVIASAGYTPLPAETLRGSGDGSVELPGGMRLSSAPLSSNPGERVFWVEDVSELMGQRRDLEAAREQISKRNALAAEEYRLLRQKQDLVEKNRLYGLMRRQTAAKVAELSGLLDRLEETDDAQTEGRLLARLSVLGTYIKRRSNLALLSEGQSVLPAAELKNCLVETLRGLSLFGVEADLIFSLKAEMSFGSVIYFYDAFQTVVERALDSLTELLVTFSDRKGTAVMSLRLCCGEDLTALALDGLSAFREDEGEWLLSVQEGGGTV